MSRLVNVACAQTEPHSDWSKALAQAIAFADNAKSAGAELIVFPEYCGGLCSEGRAFTPPAATEKDHLVLQGLIAWARNNHTWMVIGSVAIKGASDKIINRGFVISDAGEIVARYDKLHMFDITLSDTQVFRESDTVVAGGEAVVVGTPFGILGLSICYDLRFPQLYRDLSQAGAEILLVPAAFTKTTGEAHWHVLNRARAIENGAFVVAPCSIGKVNGGGECYGHSLIINPWGEVLAEGGEVPGVIQFPINIEEVAQARQKIPSWNTEQAYSLNSGSGQAVA